MKKVLINYNAKDNFGDDLFVKIICDYIPDAKFNVLAPKGCAKSLEKIKNLKIIRITPKNAEKAYSKAVAKADMCLYTGGPAFVEDSYDMHEFWDFRGMLQTKPLYYINSDFGPYRSEFFYEEAKEHLAACAGVWFRDKYSRSLFEGENIHYMPPLSLMTEFPAPMKTAKPYVVISVVDLSGRNELSVLYDKYIETIKHIALRFRNSGADVTILATCDYEWDDRAARELEGYGSVIEYKDNLDVILSLIRGAKCVIGSRFQAIMCAVAAGVPVVPVYYCDNLPRALSDLDKNIKCFDIKHLDELSDAEIDKAMKYKPAIDMKRVKKEIKRNLDKLADIIREK